MIYVPAGTPAASPSGPKRNATIYDVARLSGFSPSTVSRALNKPGRINPKTEQKIREAAEAVGYHTNLMARSVSTGRSGVLGLILSDITNPFFFDLVRSAEWTTGRAGRTLVFAETHGSVGLEQEAVQRLLPSVDGVVLASSRMEQDQIRKFHEIKPMVMVHRRVPEISSVMPELEPGIRDAIGHLAGLGHRSIAFLPGPADLWMSGRRRQILRDEASQLGITVREIAPAEPTVEGGRAALREVLNLRVTAVLAYNDLMAIGLLLGCQSKNIAVPDRLSIIGFDDIFGSSFTSPSITTIRMPLREIGEEAVHRLIAAIDGEEPMSGKILSTELVLRESTAPPVVDPAESG